MSVSFIEHQETEPVKPKSKKRRLAKPENSFSGSSFIEHPEPEPSKPKKGKIRLEKLEDDRNLPPVSKKLNAKKGPFSTWVPGECSQRWTVFQTDKYICARLNYTTTTPQNYPSQQIPKYQPVDTTGTDIGKMHNSTAGLDRTNLTKKGNWPKITALVLINTGEKAAPDACDILDSLMVSDELKWVCDSQDFYVEQQLPDNPQAKQVAQGIRSGQRVYRAMKGMPLNVTSVAGQSKYDIAPVMVPETYNDVLRQTDLRGGKMKPMRKLLGERDVFSILKSTGQIDALDMIASVCKNVDQIHDVTDSILIALSGEILKSSRGIKKATKKNKSRYGDDSTTILPRRKWPKATGNDTGRSMYMSYKYKNKKIK